MTEWHPKQHRCRQHVVLSDARAARNAERVSTLVIDGALGVHLLEGLLDLLLEILPAARRRLGRRLRLLDAAQLRLILAHLRTQMRQRTMC